MHEMSSSRSMNVADAKRRFSELLDRVAGGERFVVTRRGRPAAALVPPGEASLRDEPAQLGLLAFVGVLAEWPEFDEIVRDVVADRMRAGTRAGPELT
jgi:prevent-host-death family protein